MTQVFRTALILLSLVLVSCTTLQKSTNPPPVVQQPIGPLAWESANPQASAWSTELRDQISNNFSDLSAATNWTDYCPKFNQIDMTHQIEVMATMMVGISLFECDYQYQDFTPDVANTNSIGLFQLSYEDHMSWCSMSASLKNLTDPLVNIDCAVPEMGHLISQDSVVSYGGRTEFDQGQAKGLARYWSTMWSSSASYPQIKAKVQALPYCQ